LSTIVNLTNQFYTHIPHSFGRTVPPVLRTADMVQTKLDMLNVLSDIAQAQKLKKKYEDKMDTDEKEVEVENPLDANYNTLECDLEPVAKSSEMFGIIDQYLRSTEGGGWRKIRIDDVFEVRRHNEEKRFSQYDHITNRKLLWHGTNVAVIAAILKSGLRIMPHSGGRVGKGIYFASENGKSAGYVRLAGNTGIMLLSEVALGKEHHITQDNSSLEKPPKGHDSVIAQGHTDPDPGHDVTVQIDGKDVVVPQGKPIARSEYSGSSFSQSEFLVYNEAQNRIRFLLRLTFT